MNLRYRINIVWSDENNCYLVNLPDFPIQKWCTDGATYEEALKHGLEVMEELHLAGVHGDMESVNPITAESLDYQIA